LPDWHWRVILLFNPDAKINIEDVRGIKVLVIDDAFAEPEKYRAHAKASMPTARIRNIPIGYEILADDFGIHFPGYANELAALITEHIGQNVADFFGFNLPDVELEAFRGPYYNCVGVSKLPYFPPHSDHGHVSAFACLVLPENVTGGTRLYRHIPSDTINIVHSRTTLLDGMTKIPLDEPLVESTEEWEMIGFFPLTYNRLIAFNSSTIHKIDLTGGQFKMNIDDTRLCMNCFFLFRNPDGSIAFRKETNL
jgi:hypothetical protein